ncbi:hypothetical protein [Tardibacter chloracetimidivorans]|uniref:hypothetical protein n=1 Tax=Tardibacter chloracetimidivorans TaxID=1921510 RepID=UPI001D049F17|nr:hypothetical protein [Tardibacter chloracetimidivorans]
MIDRIANRAGRPLVEVPFGFKWFVDGLYSGALGFAGEESAGSSLLRRDGSVWTTDKGGLALGLLAAEITAHSGSDPNQAYDALMQEFGQFWYERIDALVAPEQMDVLRRATADRISATELAGEPIEAKLTTAPAGGEPFCGIKITTAGGWFAARPSGTELIYKLYAESFRSADHLRAIQREARTIIQGVFGRGQAAGDHGH